MHPSPPRPGLSTARYPATCSPCVFRGLRYSGMLSFQFAMLNYWWLRWSTRGRFWLWRRVFGITESLGNGSRNWSNVNPVLIRFLFSLRCKIANSFIVSRYCVEDHQIPSNNSLSIQKWVNKRIKNDKSWRWSAVITSSASKHFHCRNIICNAKESEYHHNEGNSVWKRISVKFHCCWVLTEEF